MEEVESTAAKPAQDNDEGVGVVEEQVALPEDSTEDYSFESEHKGKD